MDREYRKSFLYPRISGNPIEPLLGRFIDYLRNGGYSASASVAYVGAGDHLGRWLGHRPLTAQAAEQYLKHHLPRCCCQGLAPRDPRWNAGAVRHLLALEGITSTAVADFAAKILGRYRAYLVRERGLKPNSIRYSLRQATRTLGTLKARHADDLRRWTIKRVEHHVVGEMRGHTGSTNYVMIARMRVFMNFLCREKLIAKNLIGAIPKLPYWRRAKLPPGVDPEAVQQLVSAAAGDRGAMGLRDLVIILCLSELGIRASDLMSLELDGVDWTARTLCLRHVKGRKEMILPISRKLALAFKAYITKGRPRCATAWVFVHHKAPCGRQLTSAGVRDVLLKLSASAGLPVPIRSTHAFRRAFANRMLRAGASLKQIADVLGHQSINTTARYTHTDVAALSQVALPWPAAREVQP